MKMKRIAALAIALLCAFVTMIGTGVSVSAESVTETAVTAPESEEAVDAATLLQTYSFSPSTSANTLYLSAQVKAVETMAEIGFVDFVIERSRTGTGNWQSTNYDVPDQIKKNAVSHSISKYSVQVIGGFYYRVSFNFYAKETGWFFPSSQTVSYVSSAIYVPAS